MDILREVAANSGLTFEFRAGSWSEIYGAFLRLAHQALYAAKQNGRNRLEARAVQA